VLDELGRDGEVVPAGDLRAVAAGTTAPPSGSKASTSTCGKRCRSRSMAPSGRLLSISTTDRKSAS